MVRKQTKLSIESKDIVGVINEAKNIQKKQYKDRKRNTKESRKLADERKKSTAVMGNKTTEPDRS